MKGGKKTHQYSGEHFAVSTPNAITIMGGLLYTRCARNKGCRVKKKKKKPQPEKHSTYHTAFECSKFVGGTRSSLLEFTYLNYLLSLGKARGGSPQGGGGVTEVSGRQKIKC